MGSSPSSQTNITAVGTPRMKLGYNYTWAFDKYGLWFGPHMENPVLPPQPALSDGPPETWPTAQIRDARYAVKSPRPEYAEVDGWVDVLPDRFGYLHNKLQIDVVRIFLLCNAQNYGSLDGSGTYQPPQYLHPRFRWHFQQILNAAEDVGVQLIPSLLDFGIGNPDTASVRRTPILQDGAFFDTVFEPLLEMSKANASQIYAWEVMNEPSWLTGHYFPFRLGLSPGTWLPTGPAVSEQVLNDFLVEGVKRIAQHGFASTVGHRFLSDLDKFEPGSIRQFHYYPSKINADPSELPDARKIGLPILGEFGSSPDDGGPWNELKTHDAGRTDERVFQRLTAAENKGYPLALVWPDHPDPGDHEIDPLKLSSDAEAGIKKFLAQRASLRGAPSP
jgi:hypothetical protein